MHQMQFGNSKYFTKIVKYSFPDQKMNKWCYCLPLFLSLFLGKESNYEIHFSKWPNWKI